MALPEHLADQGFIVCEFVFVFAEEQATRMRGAVDEAALGQGSLDERLLSMCANAPESPTGIEFRAAVDAWRQEKVAQPKSAVPWPGAPPPRQKGVGSADYLIDCARGIVPPRFRTWGIMFPAG